MEASIKEQREEFSEALFYLQTKHYPCSKGWYLFPRDWEESRLVPAPAKDLVSVGFENIDSWTIASGLHKVTINYLLRFPKVHMSTRDSTYLPQFSGLREEDSRKIIESLVGDFWSNSYVDGLLGRYNGQITSLLDLCKQEVESKRYRTGVDTSGSLPLPNPLGFRPSSR